MFKLTLKSNFYMKKNKNQIYHETESKKSYLYSDRAETKYRELEKRRNQILVSREPVLEELEQRWNKVPCQG